MFVDISPFLWNWSAFLGQRQMAQLEPLRIDLYISLNNKLITWDMKYKATIYCSLFVLLPVIILWLSVITNNNIYGLRLIAEHTHERKNRVNFSSKRECEKLWWPCAVFIWISNRFEFGFFKDLRNTLWHPTTWLTHAWSTSSNAHFHLQVIIKR